MLQECACPNPRNSRPNSSLLTPSSSQVAEMKKTDQARLNAEYQRLVSGLADAGLGRASGGVAGSAGAGSGGGGGGAAGPAGAAAEAVAAAADSIPANPALPADILQEAVPGNIRRAEHFVSFMRKVGVRVRVRGRGGVVGGGGGGRVLLCRCRRPSTVCTTT